jgi:hypothetical protein
MNRNVTILVIILVIIVMAGYLLWLRGKFYSSQTQNNVSPAVETLTPSPTPTVASSSAEATPSGSVTPTGKNVTPTVSGKAVE